MDACLPASCKGPSQEEKDNELKARIAKVKYDHEDIHVVQAEGVAEIIKGTVRRHYEEEGTPVPPDLLDRINYADAAEWGQSDAAWEALTMITHENRTALTHDYTRMNRLKPKGEIPLWLLFIHELTGFFAMLLWVGAILCFVAYGVQQDADNLYLGIVLSGVVLITGIFTFYQNSRSASLMAQFAKLMADTVRVATDERPVRADTGLDQLATPWENNNNTEANFDTGFLVEGDIVKVTQGDKIPADIRVLWSSDCKVEQSSITGEPLLIAKGPQNFHLGGDKPDPKEADNLLFFGTECRNGQCIGVVHKIGTETYIGKIAELTESTGDEKTPIAEEIEHFVQIVSGVAIFLGIAFFIIGVSLQAPNPDWVTQLVFMIGIIVANVPEGLLATVTVSLALTASSMYKQNVLVKKMEGVETLGSTTCICSDKTGTLTQNKMTVAEVILDNKIWRTEFVEATTHEGEEAEGADDEEKLLQPDDKAVAASFGIFHRAMCLNTTASIPRDCFTAGTKQYEPFYQRRSLDQPPMVNWTPEGDASEESMIKFAIYHFPGKWSNSMPIDPAEIQATFNSDPVAEFRTRNPRVAMIPFNSSNKFHVTVTRNDNDEHPFTVWMKGAPERVMRRCGYCLVNGEVQELTDETLDHIQSLQKKLMARGRRVLAFSKHDLTADEARAAGWGGDIPDGELFDGNMTNFPLGGDVVPGQPPVIEDERIRAGHDALVETKLTFLGMTALIDPPRPGVPEAVIKCQKAGVRVVMVTGDHPDTAAAIAQMVNIFSGRYFKKVPRLTDLEEIEGSPHLDTCLRAEDGTDISDATSIVVPGWTIDAESDEHLWKFIFKHDEVVFARTSPAQKLIIVSKFQDFEKDVVAVTGDGVNDAPALRKANIGVAMGIAGTAVTKGAADMILTDDNFASIVRGVEKGRLIFDNLKKSIAYTLSSNIPEIAPFLCFITVQTPLPLSTVLILCIDLGTDMVPAISMAWETEEADIMLRPARNKAVDRLVTKKLVSFAYLQIGVIQALAGFFTWIVVLNDYGYPPHILPGNGAFDNWGQQTIFCKVKKGVWRDVDGKATDDRDGDALENGYYFWDVDKDGSIVDCTFPAKNLRGSEANDPGSLEKGDSYKYDDASAYPKDYTANQLVMTYNSAESLMENDYFPFIPYRGRLSPFWNNDWLKWNIKDSDVRVPATGLDTNPVIFFNHQLPGVYVVDKSKTDGEITPQGSAAALKALSDNNIDETDVFTEATFIIPDGEGTDASNPTQFLASYAWQTGGKTYMNIASRMVQKEALHHSQSSYFVTIVVVQWADLLICKTRWLSIMHQGMTNGAMNFGLVFETILAAFLCYVPGIDLALGTRPIRALHWVPAVPFSILIMIYDETRKYLMRSGATRGMQGKQVVVTQSWIGRQTYY